MVIIEPAGFCGPSGNVFAFHGEMPQTFSNQLITCVEMDFSDYTHPVTRREWIITSGIGVAGFSGTLPFSSDVKAEESSADSNLSIIFNDQESNGRSVVLEKIETDVDAFLWIRNKDGELVAGAPPHIRFEAGESLTDHKVVLDTIIEEDQELEAELAEENGDGSASDTAFMTVPDNIDKVEGIEPTRIEPDPDAGFNYPYYLYAPDTVSTAAKPILAEPVNTGFPTDDFDHHLKAAEKTAEEGVSRLISDHMGAPFIVPVFPRPMQNPVDSTHHIHGLDRTTLEIEEGKLERVDRQMLRMVEDARKQLNERDYPVADGLMLNGFSDAGTFVERFTKLHPNEVTSVTAGGINGMPILPLEEANGHTLDYHIGIANLEELIGEPFDMDAFREVNQFLYIGELDAHDTFTYTDAWTDNDFQDVAIDVYGRNMHRDRFPYSRAVYEDRNAGVVFRMYEGTGHTSRPALPDLIEFHERSLAGDDIENLRDDFGGNVPELGIHVAWEPDQPEVGESTTFDASRSALWEDELTDFEWEFTNETKEGQVVTHSFDDSGGHNIRVTATDTSGNTYQETYQIVVSQPDSGNDAEQPDDSGLSISFNDQASDGESVVIDKIETDEVALLSIFDEQEGRQVAGAPPHIEFDAGESVTDYEVVLDTVLEEDKELKAKISRRIYDGAAEETASITVPDDIDPIEGIEPTRIESDPEAGFNYPYYLYAPDTVSTDGKPVLAEPVNTGSPTDDFDRHLKAAENTAKQGVGHRISNSIKAPFIVPVFPRPNDNPGVHYLARNTMEIKDGPLERVDRQLLRMVEDARQQLKDRDYPVGSGLMLNGFSASGTFVERFAALHSEEVTSVTAGGVNGMPILPIEEADGHTLDYHIGVANLEELIGESLEIDAFREVNQFLYMGEFDDSDTITFFDEQQETALDVYGTYMVDDRFPYSRSVYEELDAGAVFRMYEKTGHRPVPAVPDLAEFHRRSLAGDDITDLRADLGGKVPNKHASVNYAPAEPKTVDQVAFDATNTELENSNPVSFEWEFENGETATGSTTTHTFDIPGQYAITLTVTDDTGETFQTTEYITAVSKSDGGGDGPPPVTGENPPTDSDGDGLYEDINGDGDLTISDVQVLFQHLNSSVVQNNAELFNFSGNDSTEVTLGDVQALFQLLQEGN
jgi:PKD repeat protein